MRVYLLSHMRRVIKNFGENLSRAAFSCSPSVLEAQQGNPQGAQGTKEALARITPSDRHDLRIMNESNISRSKVSYTFFPNTKSLTIGRSNMNR
jgi:hypothetical protein